MDISLICLFKKRGFGFYTSFSDSIFFDFSFSICEGDWLSSTNSFYSFEVLLLASFKFVLDELCSPYYPAVPSFYDLFSFQSHIMILLSLPDEMR